MSRIHQRRLNVRISAHSGRHHPVRSDHRSHQASPRIARAQIIARLIAAEQRIPSNAIAAALVLDGALADILSAWADRAGIEASSRDYALDALEARAPSVAARIRLALMAREPEARLAHCWALLESLTTPLHLTRYCVMRP